MCPPRISEPNLETGRHWLIPVAGATSIKRFPKQVQSMKIQPYQNHIKIISKSYRNHKINHNKIISKSYKKMNMCLFYDFDMILIWFRYGFDMILLWFWYDKSYDFFMVLGCLYFCDMISIWFFYDFGVPSNFWYDFAMVLGRYLLVGLGCFAVSSAGSCLRMGMEAIRRNTGRLEGETFLLGHCLANDISDSKLWLRKKKNFLTLAGQNFIPA